MVVNLTSRRHRIYIGTDQQDWSAHYKGPEVGYSSIDDGGLIEITATLELLGTATAPESIDPRRNPSRWRPGQPVYLQVRNGADTAWLDPWYSRLIITEEPASPANGRLTLELGCKLAWADLFELDDEQSGVTFGQAETCNVIASRLLQASEVAPGDISLSAWPYSIDYPFGKEGGGSFAGQAGELAWCNDARYLYQNPAGQVTDRQLSLASTGSAVATVTIGTNDADWTPLQSGEQPPETTKVAGVGYQLNTLTSPEVNVDEVEANIGDYVPNAAGTGVVQRTTTTDSFFVGDPDNTPAPLPPTKTNAVEIRELEALIFQRPTVPTQLLKYQERTVTKTYEAGLADPTQAKLLSIVEELKQREKSIVPDGVFINMRTVFRTTTNFTHGADELITRVQRVEEQAEIILDEASTDPWNLQTTRAEDLTWTDEGAGVLRNREVIQTALITESSAFDRFQQNPWALRTRTRTYPASRSNTPPATEFFDAGTTQEELHYEGTASYTHRGGSTGRNRQRLFTVPFGFNNPQMIGLAAVQRDLMIGRHLGDQIELPITDALLTTPPLPEVWVIHQGQTYRYLADALALDFADRKDSASCVGIWLEGGYELPDTPITVVPAEGEGEAPNISIPQLLTVITAEGEGEALAPSIVVATNFEATEGDGEAVEPLIVVPTNFQAAEGNGEALAAAFATINSIPSLVGDFSADSSINNSDAIPVNGDPIKQLLNRVSGGANGTIQTGSAQPQYVASSANLNGQPTILTDGIDDFLEIPFSSLLTGTDFTLVHVFRFTTTGSLQIGPRDTLSGTGTLVHAYISDNTAYYRINNAPLGTAYNIVDESGTTARSYTFRKSGTTGEVFRNGVSRGSTTVGAGLSIGANITIGRNGPFPNFYAIEWARTLVFDAALTPTEQTTVNNELALYGI